MKKIQFLALCALILALGAVARAEGFIKPASVTVAGIQGQARYSTDGQKWHPLVVGKILRSGAIIETAANSGVDLVISGTPVPIPQNSSAPQNMSFLSQAPDPNVRGYASATPLAQQNVIHMMSQTMLAVDKLTTIDTGADSVSDTELDLRAGKIFASVKKMSASSQFIIKIPNGVAGIRGSSGTLDASGEAAWYHGIIVLSEIGANGQPRVLVVHGGFEYNSATGEIIAVSPQVLAALEALSISTQTLYAQVVSLPHDITIVVISNRQGVEESQSEASPPEEP